MSSTVPVTLGELNFVHVLIAFAVILLGIDVYVKVMSAVKTHREEKRRREQPVDSLEERVEENEKKLRKDYERLNALEDGNRIMMRAMMALLSHDINGNSVDKLKEAMDEIQKYLIDR